MRVVGNAMQATEATEGLRYTICGPSTTAAVDWPAIGILPGVGAGRVEGPRGGGFGRQGDKIPRRRVQCTVIFEKLQVGWLLMTTAVCREGRLLVVYVRYRPGCCYCDASAGGPRAVRDG